MCMLVMASATEWETHASEMYVWVKENEKKGENEFCQPHAFKIQVCVCCMLFALYGSLYAAFVLYFAWFSLNFCCAYKFRGNYLEQDVSFSCCSCAFVLCCTMYFSHSIRSFRMNGLHSSYIFIGYTCMGRVLVAEYEGLSNISTGCKSWVCMNFVHFTHTHTHLITDSKTE